MEEKTKNSGGATNKAIIARLVNSGQITEKEAEQLMRKKKEKGCRMPAKDLSNAIKVVGKEYVKQQAKQELVNVWNSNITNHIKKVATIKKPLLDNAGSIRRAIQDYFNYVNADKVKPSVAGLALALGVSRPVLIDWANGNGRVIGADIIQSAMQMLEMYDEMALLDGGSGSNPVAVMFHLKNNHGYKDSQEIVHSKDGQDLSDKEIADKYKDIGEVIDVDVESK